MAGSTYIKNIRRTIFGSLGRYIAILAIIALGVGFFAGVKNTKGSMMETCDKFVNDYSLYDYRLISTYGFTDDEVDAMRQQKEVKAAEGAVSADFFSVDGKGNSIKLRAHSLTEDVNRVKLVDGRQAEAAGECVADDHFYSADDIGKTISVTDENTEATKEQFSCKEYKIVGIIKSPYYLMKTERGTTSLGDGSLDAFIYVPRAGFTSEYYTEMLITLSEGGFIFSDQYNENIDKAESPITETAKAEAERRIADIKAEIQEKIDAGQAELDDGRAELDRERASAYAKLKSAKSELDDNSAKLESGKKELEEQKSDLTAKRAQAENSLKQAEGALAEAESMGYPQEQIAQIEENIIALEKTLAQIDAGLGQISEAEKDMRSNGDKLAEGYREYNSNKAAAEIQLSAAESKLKAGEAELDQAREEMDGIEEPEIYVQTREDNIGFDSFESNSDIVDSIAKVFPVFFFLIAALVCSTTMSRMVEEERTQIGALRAMGYTDGKIIMKYMIYSGSAAMIGCVAGFFAGSKYFPYAIWIAYGMMFGFAPLEFYFSWQLAVISLIVSLICSMGTTYFACRGQLKNTPAEILRPKAPKAGKRILLERVGFIWNRLKFLHKVTVRNILRYKKRMVMMILGIGGCTALVLAGFGINDSVAGIADHQFSQIERYHMTAAFSEELEGKKLEDFKLEYGDELSNIAVLQQASVNASGVSGKSGVSKTCNLMVTNDDNITGAVNFTDGEKKLSYPDKGEALINNKLADMLGIKAGDEIKIKYDDTKEVTLKVSGVYRNYVSNYIYISGDTYQGMMDKDYQPTVAFLTFKDKEKTHEIAESINEYDGVIAISINEDVKDRVDDMMVSLNYIIILVIGCAGALAFIVLFNLSNINITERIREIATIEVLGFYPRETGAYVFRENFILALLGIIVGLPAGFALHKFIMARIIVDAVTFNDVIEVKSYLYAVIVVICFTLIVDIIMRRKLKRINMAEALKSIE